MTEIDLRTIHQADRRARLLTEFDRLPPDARLLLESDEEPKPLLHALQEERAGSFEWNVLERAPGRFRAEIVRRREGPAARAVTECLMTDHRRLDAILAEVESLVAASDHVAAAQRFAEFSCGLDRHIEMEESILFPVFERASGTARGGPTEVMRQEHAAIRDFMGAALSGIRERDRAAFTRSIAGLRDTLGPHNAKEEHVLYPMTDSVLGGESARDHLVRRMQEV